MACASQPTGIPMLKCCSATCGRGFFPHRYYTTNAGGLFWAEVRAGDGPCEFKYYRTQRRREVPPGNRSWSFTTEPFCGAITENDGPIPPGVVTLPQTEAEDQVSASLVADVGEAIHDATEIDTSPPVSFSEVKNFGTLVQCTTISTSLFPNSFGPFDPLGGQCMVASVARTKSPYNTLNGDNFFATKGVIWMWGAYRVSVYKALTRNSLGCLVISGDLISSSDHRAPDLVFDISGNIVWPQPIYTPVILNPMPQTVIQVYSLAG